MQKNRILKVYAQTRRSERTGFFSPTTYTDVPAILLSGKWLESAGFSIADHVSVTVDNGKLVIMKQEDPS